MSKDNSSNIITGIFDFIVKDIRKAIKETRMKNDKPVGVGVYTTEYCEENFFTKPYKSLEHRKEIASGLEGVDFVFEVVRRNDDWQNMFAEKVQLYSDFYENFTKNDAGFAEKPQVVFVGEDIQHIAEMFRIIKKVGMILEDKDMYFTTELRHLEESLENSISVFELEKDTKKYKVVTKQLDILKLGENSAANTKLNEDTKYNANMIIE